MIADLDYFCDTAVEAMILLAFFGGIAVPFLIVRFFRSTADDKMKLSFVLQRVWLMTLVPTGALVLSVIIPSKYNIRADLLFTIPLILFVLGFATVFSFRYACRAK